MQGREQGDQTKHSEWLSLNLGKAAGNQPPLEVIQIVTEETCRLAAPLGLSSQSSPHFKPTTSVEAGDGLSASEN